MRPFHDEVPPCLADEGSDLSVPGIPGIQELQVDARDGKVLSSEREGHEAGSRGTEEGRHPKALTDSGLACARL